MCAGANRQRSHLWDHPGLLPRLRVQRWLQLAAVVKAAEGVARLGWNCFISFIIMIIIVLVLRLPFCSCICYLWWWPPSHINRQQQTSAIHGPFYFYCCFFLLPVSCWTELTPVEQTTLVLSLTSYLMLTLVLWCLVFVTFLHVAASVFNIVYKYCSHENNVNPKKKNKTTESIFLLIWSFNAVRTTFVFLLVWGSIDSKFYLFLKTRNV